MKKWLVLAFLPLLLLVQQEASATLITTLISPPSGTVPPANYSLTLTMNDARDVITALATFDNTVTLTRVGQTLSDNSLLQLLIAPLSLQPVYLNIYQLTGLSSDLVVTGYDTALKNFTINPPSPAAGRTITGIVNQQDDASFFDSLAEWFDTTYWDNAADEDKPYSFMQQCSASLCEDQSNTQYPLVPVLSVLSVPVPNSSMLLVIGLAALMVTLRRTRQFQ